MHRTKDGTELAGCRPSPSGDRQPEPEAPEGHYLPNCKQASLLSLLGVLDGLHLPEKVRQLYTQKTERQGQGRR